jgi:DNA-binding MarR family transcriptional regulator
MSIQQSLESLKSLINRVDNVSEQKRLISSIIEEYGNESNGFAQLKEEHSILKAEHEKFKAGAAAEMAALKTENAQLKAKPGGQLDPVSTQILIRVANLGGRSITDRQIIQQLQLSPAKGDFHFTQLEKRGLINSSCGLINGGGSFYHATEKGLEYLASNDLL